MFHILVYLIGNVLLLMSFFFWFNDHYLIKFIILIFLVFWNISNMFLKLNKDVQMLFYTVFPRLENKKYTKKEIMILIASFIVLFISLDTISFLINTK